MLGLESLPPTVAIFTLTIACSNVVFEMSKLGTMFITSVVSTQVFRFSLNMLHTLMQNIPEAALDSILILVTD